MKKRNPKMSQTPKKVSKYEHLNVDEKLAVLDGWHKDLSDTEAQFIFDKLIDAARRHKEGRSDKTFDKFPWARDKILELAADRTIGIAERLKSMILILRTRHIPREILERITIREANEELYQEWQSPAMSVAKAQSTLAMIVSALHANAPQYLEGVRNWSTFKPTLLALIERSTDDPVDVLYDVAKLFRDNAAYDKNGELNMNTRMSIVQAAPGGDNQIPISHFIKKMKGSTHNDKEAHGWLSDIIADAVKAKHNASNPDGPADEGIYEGCHQERDEILALAIDTGPLKAKLDKAVSVLGKIVEKHNVSVKVSGEALKKKLVLEELLARIVVIDEGAGYVLQPNDCSRLHKLYEAIKSGLVAGMLPKGEHDKKTLTLQMNDEFIPFIVRHNWAAVLGDSTGDKEGQVLMPAPLCAFEFRISGLNCIYLVQDQKDLRAKPFFPDQWRALFVEGVNDFWLVVDSETKLAKYVKAQADAACIVLEAQVAKSVLTDPPAALNKKRKAQGKLPLYSFHTVDLSREKKRHTSHGDDESGTRHRLHFVRAHDRTYKESQITIRIGWHLRGDPQLGVIDKLYKL